PYTSSLTSVPTRRSSDLHHGKGQRHGELPIELAGDAAEEGDRHEHRAQHEHDGDHRAGDFAHRLDRGIEGHHVVLAYQPLDVLQDRKSTRLNSSHLGSTY